MNDIKFSQKKSYIISIIAVVISAILLILVLGMVIFMILISAVKAADIPTTIKMNSKIYSHHTKNIVNFPHLIHSDKKGISCIECHHIYKGGKNIWKKIDKVEKCDTCHRETKKPKDLKISKKEKIERFHYSAIHKSCKGCHRDLKKEKKDTGPTTCNNCHKKDSQ